MSQVQALIEQAVAAAEAKAREVAEAALEELHARLEAAETKVEALEKQLSPASAKAAAPVASRTRTTKA
jgi:hypothetical protein